jgi:hypothetical protein
MECKDGICLIPTNKFFLKCPNFIVCNNRLNNVYDDGLCMDCHSLFGKWRNFNNSSILKIKDSEIECPLCNIIDINIKRPHCEHTLCINCFKKLYYGIELERPIHPNTLDDDVYSEYLNKLNYWNKFKKLFESSATSKCFQCSFS